MQIGKDSMDLTKFNFIFVGTTLATMFVGFYNNGIFFRTKIF
jgi:hypothetical protein